MLTWADFMIIRYMGNLDDVNQIAACSKDTVVNILTVRSLGLV